MRKRTQRFAEPSDNDLCERRQHMSWIAGCWHAWVTQATEQVPSNAMARSIWSGTITFG